jgi:hypothetical protein
LAILRRDLGPPVSGANDSTFVDIVGEGGERRATVAFAPGISIAAFDGAHFYAVLTDSSRQSGVVIERRPEPVREVVRYRIAQLR